MPFPVSEPKFNSVSSLSQIITGVKHNRSSEVENSRNAMTSWSRRLVPLAVYDISYHAEPRLEIGPEYCFFSHGKGC